MQKWQSAVQISVYTLFKRSLFLSESMKTSGVCNCQNWTNVAVSGEGPLCDFVAADCVRYTLHTARYHAPECSECKPDCQQLHYKTSYTRTTTDTSPTQAYWQEKYKYRESYYDWLDGIRLLRRAANHNKTLCIPISWR